MTDTKKDPLWLLLLQLLTFFLVIIGTSSSGSDNFVLFVSLDGNCFIHKCSKQYFNLVHKLNLDGNIANMSTL